MESARTKVTTQAPYVTPPCRPPFKRLKSILPSPAFVSYRRSP
jgi:hypothetical protein